jgi:predicted HicB family RNase H-like nuclease
VTRGHRTEVRLAPAEHAALLALAKAAGMTISDYVRAKVLEAVPR